MVDKKPDVQVATLLEDRVLVWDEETAHYLYNNFFYGKKLDDKRLQLSLVETMYLIESCGMQVTDMNTDMIMTAEKFMSRAEDIESDFRRKYEVYADLRKSGMTAKTGFKFGSHFRVYDTIINPEEMTHSKYLVHAIPGTHVFSLQELSRSIRLAHSVRKRMLFACKDSNQKLDYIDIGRIKL